MTFVAGGERRQGSLCERCARLAVGRQGAGMRAGIEPGPSSGRGFGPARQRTAERQRSQTPALDSFGRDLKIEGVLLTMYDSRLNLSRQVADDAREYFGTKVFESVVPRNVRLAEAPSFGKPIILYDVTSVGAQAYMNVAKELIQRTAQGENGGQ